MGYYGDERRRYPRSRKGLTVVDSGGPGVLNHVDNISANGVLCHTVKPIPLMTRLSIALDLPDPVGVRIDAEGVVVRCDPDPQGDDQFRVAILFTRLDDEEHESLRRYVEHDIAQVD